MSNVFQLPTDVLRPLPANVEAEQALLGTILMRAAAYDKVADFLRPEHFVDPACAKVFGLIVQMTARGQRPSPVTLKAHAETDPDISAAGGPAFIARLCGCAPTFSNAEEYGLLIRDHYLRRELISCSSQAASRAYDGTDDAERQIEDLEESLFALQAARTSSTFVSLGEASKRALAQADAAFKANGKLLGVPTGIADLDHKLGGLRASDLIILAGRPSMGKSGLGLTLSINAARAGKVVAFFSLEMSGEQLANRAVAHFATLDSHKIRSGRITAADFQKMVMTQQEFEGLPLHIEDAAGQTVAQIRTACRRLKRKQLDLVVIDYLQLINGTGKGENRVQEVSGITWGLKCLAKDLDVPIIALSQLSRAVESREDKRPMLSDLRESGSIEQDADVVMFVYREQYYAERAGRLCPPEQENVAEIIISKQRHGPIGPVSCHFDQKSAWFSNLTRRNAE